MTVRYLLRRLAWVALMLLLVATLVFLIFEVLPSGDPAAVRAGRHASPEAIAAARDALGLDRPLVARYLDFLSGLMHLDLGYSFITQGGVREQVLTALPATFSLAAGAALVWLVVGIGFGALAATRHRRPTDRIISSGALLAFVAPGYVTGLFALFAVSSDGGAIRLLPGAGSYVSITEDPWAWAGSLVLPWLVLAAPLAGVYARVVRASLLETLAEDFVVQARARGVPDRTIVLRHALRPALTPVVTLAGLDLAALLSGAVLVEIVFNIPGVGRLALDAVINGDLPMIEGTVLFAALMVLLANLVVDVAYAWLDPRVTLSGERVS